MAKGMAQTLTCGERLVRCLTGEAIDRVPFGVNLGWEPWGETLDRWRVESGLPDLNVGRELGYDLGFACPALECGPLPHFAEAVLSETAEYIVSRDWRGITMRNRRDAGSIPEFLDYPVKKPADWERLKDERLRLDDAGQRATQDWDAFRERLARTGEAVQVGGFPWGVFGTVRDLLGVEEMLVAFCTEPLMIADMMDHMTSLWIGIWQRVAAEVQIDHIHIWEDMSGRHGSLISPKMIERFMMPCYDRITSFALSHGVRVISVDTDGDCSQLVPMMMRHGVNMLFPFEVQAGNTIEVYRQMYPHLGIMCGLDKRSLAGTKGDVDREIARADRMMQLGRYVPGFDHLIPPDASWDLFRYAAERIKDLCLAPAG